MQNTEELLRAALMKVPGGLAEHVMRVLDEALRLADIHGVSRDAVTVAVLGHDLLRAHSPERLVAIAEEQGYWIEGAERLEPLLMHGPLAVRILRDQYGVHDADVLGAVASHTSGAPGMSKLQKLVFVADKIEPEKLEGRPDAERVRTLAETDLDAAFAAYLDILIAEAVAARWPLHASTIAARNELLARARARTPKS
jgi:predicted HD superfamily hydrolase involved in NAD metabolism